MTENRLRWEKDRSFWEAYNDSDEYRLGYLSLEMVGSHKHWCWYQESGVRMSGGCLQEVRDMQKKLFKERKND